MCPPEPFGTTQSPDSIIIYAVKNNLSVMDLNKLLEEYKELTLQ